MRSAGWGVVAPVELDELGPHGWVWGYEPGLAQGRDSGSELFQVGAAAVAGLEMTLEPGLLTARKSALQIVGEKLNRLLAAQFLPASQACENPHTITPLSAPATRHLIFVVCAVSDAA